MHFDPYTSAAAPDSVRLGPDTVMSLRFVTERTTPRRRRTGDAMNTGPGPTPPTGWLNELEPIVEQQLQLHLENSQEWSPQHYVPRNRRESLEGPPGGLPTAPARRTLPSAVEASLIVNLLTEDNLPSYHHGIANSLGQDGAWATWVHRWTAEEERHADALRSYLHATRAVDPIELERMRMYVIGAGPPAEQPQGLHSIAHVALQELATSISHRNTGQQSGDPFCDSMVDRIATDENLHMVFYRGLLGASFDAWPDQTMRALADTVTSFRMPGHTIPGFHRMSLAIAYSEIYSLRIHRDDVLKPLLRAVDALHRSDLTPEGKRAQDELGTFLTALDTAVSSQEEKIQIHRQRNLHSSEYPD